ncbi:NAD(P)/FAD-dependent oxidoreductase [Bordetella bronchiseptica]|uniref:NAD(P)/FAD-dependent oxidoreductase n=1 Tax=Bordetella bronchiseptica TaxID=518 RepID=UPI00045BAA6E|nr:FAD-dependent oxidoreductase [Bordetella bronchiseptica]KAK52510.1 pyridine nucleotide-disulfide oxidoreductase [Bordetella bronchiseptica OSU054]KDB73238.1 pyridine nucleotide-disulfide oxidoreductase [Bordetella bronchiseptica CA90 BB1334]KDC23378.1 pyridine nucleotide-disulfide oxidoreductase [Bordetella bronchiseptica E014]KDC64535.1 pyridine nucleotide-disulfide oxidoreductase [Bordetella bronchiseptica MBORD591]KDD43899.1 pyridine nucleotide-disulfide oxidoreductase [Bordetella bronch
MDEIQSIVIVGAGQAGAVAAASLRQLGYRGGLTLVGQEAHPPYERPPLSKAVLQGTATHAEAAVHPAGFYAENDIALLTETAVAALDPAARTVRLADGRTLAYDRCLLATGGHARELPALPRGRAGVHYIRTLDDALDLRAALRPGVRAAVIGGGFLGLEVASTARELGAEVTVIENGSRLLERALPAIVSDWLAERVRASGVDLRLGGAIAAIGDGPPYAITLADGTQVNADLIVVSIGLAPEVALARQAGLPLDDNGGICVDSQARTADPQVYAAGDCASQPRACLGTAARFESWQNANEQARAAAAAMLGLAPAAEPYPWFWTDQYGCNIQILGLPQPGLRYVCRPQTDPQAAPRVLWIGLRDGVPCHGIAVNAGGDLRQLRVLFERGIPVDPHRLADPAEALKPLVKAWQAAVAVA